MALHLEFQDNVAVLRHDDGKRNVFSPESIRDFNDALDEIEAKKAALMWMGREDCFSAGFDLKVVKSGDADAAAAMVQAGATGLFASKALNVNQKSTIEGIFNAVGYACWVNKEDDIDAVTAVSGSGPAYFFLIYEAMQKVGEELGLDAETSAQLTLNTALGAAKLALHSDQKPEVLRKQVTSPGGTTQAAIESFQAQKIENVFRTAMSSALNRAQEMSDDFSK